MFVVPFLNALNLVVVFLFVILIVQVAYYYRKNKSKVDVQKNSIKFYPPKIRFFILYYILALCLIFPLLIIAWVINRDIYSIQILLSLELFFAIALDIMSYPYYTIVVSNDMINGPSLWNWMWRREEIRLGELDKEKIRNQNYCRRLGLVIFYSKNGKKILSLGLTNTQVNKILDLESQAQAVK